MASASQSPLQRFSEISISDNARVHVGNAYYTSNHPEGDLESKARTCRGALFLTDPAIDRESLISAKGERVPGTCEWIRRNDTYQKWRLGNPPLLWISGGPGKGKTMMSIFLTQELENTVEPNTQVVYYFCRNDDEQRNSASTILRGLLWQFLQRRPRLAAHLSSHFETPERIKSSISSPQTLWTVFANILQDPDMHPTTCVLDGLDECDNSSRAWLIKKLVALMMPKTGVTSQSTTGSPSTLPFRLALVSRPLPGLERSTRLRLDPDYDKQIKSDIKIYVTDRVSELSSRIDLGDDFREYVGSELLQRAQGTFLWVGFAINELLEKQTCSEIEEALNGLPEGLPAIYRRMLLQIQPHRRSLCADILHWVALAARPMNVTQLAAAVGVKPTKMLTAEAVMRDHLILCGPLLTIQNKRVILVHQSARDYLLQEKTDDDAGFEEFRVRPEEGHLKIAQRCLDYIQLDGLEEWAFPQQHRLGTLPRLRSVRMRDDELFLGYSIYHWPEHVIQSSSLAASLMDHPSGFFEWGSVLEMRWERAYRFKSLGFNRGNAENALHMACFLGVLSWVEHLLRGDPQRPNTNCVLQCLGILKGTPLHSAAEEGHEAVVRLLLERGADASAEDIDGDTALDLARWQGHEAVTRLLERHAQRAAAET